MNWIDSLWPTMTGACLTTALIHLRTGLSGASRRMNLFYALVAFIMADFSWNELQLIHANSPAEYPATLHWHLP